MGMVAGAVVLLLLLLLAAAMLHVFLGWPLLVGVALFALCAGRLGRTGREIGKMIADGLGKAWIVVQVLIVIGLLSHFSSDTPDCCELQHPMRSLLQVMESETDTPVIKGKACRMPSLRAPSYSVTL